MKLTEKSAEVLNYVKTNGGKVSIPELAEALGRTERSVGANVTDLTKKELAAREKVEVEGAEKPITYVVLTDAGMNFVPSEDEE
jgi:DNA-binding MarR family transcriptional regulator